MTWYEDIKKLTEKLGQADAWAGASRWPTSVIEDAIVGGAVGLLHTGFLHLTVNIHLSASSFVHFLLDFMFRVLVAISLIVLPTYFSARITAVQWD